MSKFKVAKGLHSEGGKVYSEGQVVESDNDLVTLFPNKFISLDAPAPEAEEGEEGEEGVRKTTTQKGKVPLKREWNETKPVVKSSGHQPGHQSTTR